MGNRTWRVTNITGAAAALALPVFIKRLRTQRPPVVAVTSFYFVSLLGLLVAPSAGAWVWVCVYGVAQGAGFSLALTLMVLRSPDTAVAARLSGVAQLVGYLFAATDPVLLGVVHDLTGGWEWPIVVLIVALGPMLWVGLGAGRDVLLGDEPTRDPANPAVRGRGMLDGCHRRNLTRVRSSRPCGVPGSPRSTTAR